MMQITNVIPSGPWQLVNSDNHFHIRDPFNQVVCSDIQNEATAKMITELPTIMNMLRQVANSKEIVDAQIEDTQRVCASCLVDKNYAGVEGAAARVQWLLGRRDVLEQVLGDFK